MPTTVVKDKRTKAFPGVHSMMIYLIIQQDNIEKLLKIKISSERDATLGSAHLFSVVSDPSTLKVSCHSSMNQAQ